MHNSRLELSVDCSVCLNCLMQLSKCATATVPVCVRKPTELWGGGVGTLAVAACHLRKPHKHLRCFLIFVLLLFRAALNPCGTDDRVKLPNLTDEEVNWQGLEDLYSINESLYQCRHDFSPGPDDRANFRKDVDKMFALRRILNRHNKSRELDDSTLPELGSGAGVGDLLEGSGEEPASGAPIWSPWAGDVHLTAPSTPSRALVSEEDLETIDNNLPGPVTVPPPPPLPLRPQGDRPVLRSRLWAQLEELEGETYSGNGLMELETRHDAVLRTHNSLQGSGRSPDGETGLRLGLVLEAEDQEDDIFQAQGYLQVSAPKPKAITTTAATITGAPTATTTAPIINSTTTNTTSNTIIDVTATSTATQTSSPHGSSLTPPLPLDFEGSGLPLSQPSNWTL